MALVHAEAVSLRLELLDIVVAVFQHEGTAFHGVLAGPVLVGEPIVLLQLPLRLQLDDGGESVGANLDDDSPFEIVPVELHLFLLWPPAHGATDEWADDRELLGLFHEAALLIVLLCHRLASWAEIGSLRACLPIM